MKTVRRDMLMKLAKQGKLVCVQSYYFDDMTGENRGANEMPVRVKSGYGDYKEGFINVDDHDFKGHGRAWKNADGTITLIVHSNLNYTFKIVA